MITFTVTVILVLISVSEQQQQMNNFDEYGKLIDSVQGQRFNSPPRVVPELSDEYGYEISNGKLVIKPCASRRSMPENWGYPMPVNTPLASRSGYPTRKDRPQKSLNSAILVEQFPTEITNQYEVSTPLTIQPKPQTTTEQEQINDYELEPNNEAEEHIKKHNEAVPSHGDSQSQTIPVKDEKFTTQKVTIFHPVSQTATKEKNKVTHDNSPAISKRVETVEDPNELIHNKVLPVSGPDQPRQKVLLPNQATLPQNNCVQSQNSENTQSDVNNFAPNSRRSMGEMPEMRHGPLTSRVPDSTMKRIRDQKRQEFENSKSPNSDSDDLNRHGYPSSLLPYSPGLLIASSPVTPRAHSVFDPTKGAGIAPLRDSQLAMMESPRVCYACTTLNDPSCHYPQRGTTVKYCRPGHHSCLTKTVKSTSSIDKDLIVIRDCGDLCDTGSTAPLVVSHSCSICSGDLCNDSPVDSGAFSFTPLTALLVFIVTWSIKIAI